MAVVHVNAVAAKRRTQPFRMLAIGSREQLLRLQILEGDTFTVRQRMAVVDDELKAFGEQRPGIEPVPLFTNLGGNAEFGFALLEKFPDFPAVAAQEAEFQTVEQPLDLVEMRNQQRQVDGMGKGNPERTNLAALKGRGKLACAVCGFKALLEQRMHAQAEFGQLRRRPLAAKQIPAELSLDLLDRPLQRSLGHMALVSGAREVEHARDGAEVADLMHLHDRALASSFRILADKTVQ